MSSGCFVHNFLQLRQLRMCDIRESLSAQLGKDKLEQQILLFYVVLRLANCFSDIVTTLAELCSMQTSLQCKDRAAIMIVRSSEI